MARQNDSLRTILYIGGAYVTYKIAIAGGFGPSIQKAVAGLGATAKATVGTILPGGGGVTAPGAGAGTGAKKSPPPFDSMNYVAPYGSGFIAVVNGVIITAEVSQAEAEHAYNQARGF